MSSYLKIIHLLAIKFKAISDIKWNVQAQGCNMKMSCNRQVQQAHNKPNVECIATLWMPACLPRLQTTQPSGKRFTHVLFQLNKDLFALDDIEGNGPGLDAAIQECGVDEVASIRSGHSNISE